MKILSPQLVFSSPSLTLLFYNLFIYYNIFIRPFCNPQRTHARTLSTVSHTLDSLAAPIPCFLFFSFPFFYFRVLTVFPASLSYLCRFCSIPFPHTLSAQPPFLPSLFFFIIASPSTDTEMAEAEQPSRKRFREENEATEEEEEESRRRSCSYRHIISMLESEEEDPALEDLSSLISSLQQELSSSDDNDSSAADQPVQSSSNENHPTSSPPVSKEGSEEEVFEEMMTMRHLLQASDDELGIPTAENEEGRFEEEEDDVVRICNYDGFWEMEDEAANYYTLLQSELFM